MDYNDADRFRNVIQINTPKTLSMLIPKEGAYLLWIQR